MRTARTGKPSPTSKLESHYRECRNETLDCIVIVVHVGMRKWTGKSLLQMSACDTGQESPFCQRRNETLDRKVASVNVRMRHWTGKSLLCQYRNKTLD